MVQRIYLDNNATTPVLPEVARQLTEIGFVGNPSSIHSEGRRARALLEEARVNVARWAGCSPDAVIFTSGGTEANALAVHALCRRAEEQDCPRVMAMNGGSHASIRENVIHRKGWIVEDKILERSSVVFEIAAHNETGAIADVGMIVAAAKRSGAFLHVDAVQMPGKLEFGHFSNTLLEADSFSISGHKIGAPMGAGALICPGSRDHPGRRESAFEFEPLIRGGGQESGRRSGTPPLAAIVGLGCAIGLSYDRQHCRALAVRLRDRLASLFGDEIEEISRCETGLVGTLLIAFKNIPGEVMAPALDSVGVAASYGTACSSGEQAPSAALLGLGIDEAVAQTAIRFSMGPANTAAEMDEAAARIREAADKVRSSLHQFSAP